MVFAEKVPICIQSRANIPSRIAENNRPTLKTAEVITYDIMVEEAITIAEMYMMGCNMQQVFYCWGERPTANNLSFKNMNAKCLNAVKCILQGKVLSTKFTDVRWFEVGLTIQDIIDLQPTVETLKVFNVTVESLMQNKAHDFGDNWQTMFKWSSNDWKQLGFDAKTYAAALQKDSMEKGVEPDKLRIHQQWGPQIARVLR